MIPDMLARLGSSSSGRTWLEVLPQLLEECVERWSLQVGEPLAGGSSSLVLEAALQDGSDAILKIQFPHHETEHEATALSYWNGDGAVRLLARDPHRNALLLERCRPGTPLSELELDAALDVMVTIFPRLWKPADAPFTPLAKEAGWWAQYLPEKWERASRPFEPELLAVALEDLHSLPASQGHQVLLHQDLHADNVLRAEREPWLVIDPKPLIGEREFGIAALVRGGELGHSRDAIHHRLERLCSELVLDLERARRWTIAQTLAWAFDGDDVLPGLIECARWLHEGT
jgi:streptomycin 6-kinase